MSFHIPDPWYLLLLIPVISGVIGYGTNVVAIKMMFYPVEFVGIKPFLGWQGIVPANAVYLAKTSLQLVMTRLLAVQDLFRGVSAEDFIAPSEKAIQKITEEVIEQQASKHFPALWNAMGPEVKEQIFTIAHQEVRSRSSHIIGEVIDNIEDLIDIQDIVVQTVRKDKTLMNRMFLEIGAKEFKFIEKSGAYFGFLFGLIQLIIWVIYPAWWVLPFFGFAVGYATNWIAIKLIFEPREPRTYAGLTVQGLFHQRQTEVAAEFGAIVSNDVFTDQTLFLELTKPASKEKILGLVQQESDSLVKKYKNHPLTMGMLTDDLIDTIDNEVRGQVEGELFRPDGVLGAVTRQSNSIRSEIQTRLSQMDPESFESVLRPAFQQDEWKLIIAGAVLGLGAGVLQLVYIFGEMLL